MAAPGGTDSRNRAVDRVVADGVGVDTMETLVGLSGSDLVSLLLEVMSRRASRRSPGDIVRQYEIDRFTRPAQVDPRTLLSLSSAAVDCVMPDFELVETAPLVPLGTHSVIAGISQDRVVSTIRTTEVAADPTNSLALEAATRRRTLLRDDPRSPRSVQLASIDRVVRAQRFDGPRSFAHFTLLGLVTAGRDVGNRRFEADALTAQLNALTAACRSVTDAELLITLTDLDGNNAHVLETCEAAMSEGVSVERWPDRAAGRTYYESVCFKLSVVGPDGTVEVADGGTVNWTQSLLENRKERLMIGGLSIERLAHLVEPHRE